MRLKGLIAVWAMLMCGCSTQATVKNPEVSPSPPASQGQRPPVPAPTAPVSRAEATRIPQTAGQIDALDDSKSLLSKRSVYFDFDSTAVRAEFGPLIEAHARYMTANRGSQVRLEGNCDERGSREYNLALGNRRAEAVKAALKLLGVAEEQVEAISLGEEKPKAMGHDEAAWVENRRADIVYVRRR